MTPVRVPAPCYPAHRDTEGWHPAGESRAGPRVQVSGLHTQKENQEKEIASTGLQNNRGGGGKEGKKEKKKKKKKKSR